MTSISIVAYLALFAGVAFAFVFASLLLGRFVRPHAPSAQKLETYECGEPAIGSSYVQFDLRFYVVALVFIIFEVEMAFFFPWATVFGKVTRLRCADLPAQAAADTYRELGVDGAGRSAIEGQAGAGEPSAAQLQRLALASMADIGLFFAVLLVGFAYVWSRGDLDLVRAHRTARPGIAAESVPSQGATA
jgi:NADH-quinone oxidoreductase subunit A